MSGKIENFIDPLMHKWIPKIPGLSALSNDGEFELATLHFWNMFGTTMLFNFLGWYWVTLASVALVAIAEWPPEGRGIDRLTRGFGWLLGAIPAAVILIKRFV